MFWFFEPEAPTDRRLCAALEKGRYLEGDATTKNKELTKTSELYNAHPLVTTV